MARYEAGPPKARISTKLSYSFSLICPAHKGIDTFVQLVFADPSGLIESVKTMQSTSSSELHFAAVAAAAEQELSAFMKAVTDSFGPKEAIIAADDWIQELDLRETLPGASEYDWRSMTIAAAARLAERFMAQSKPKK